MEITIAWFWLIKLAFLISTSYMIYKAIKTKNPFLWIIVAAMLLIAYIHPIKMNLNTQSQNTRSNAVISQTKELPPRVTDNSFDSTTLKGITQEDMK